MGRFTRFPAAPAPPAPPPQPRLSSSSLACSTPTNAALQAVGDLFPFRAEFMASTLMGQFENPNSTEVNKPQLENCGQTLTTDTADKPKMVDWSIVAKCADELDAIVKCVHISGIKHEWIRDTLGIDKGHWTRLMQGNGNFPTQKRGQLMQLCGNLLPLQFEAMRFGFQLYENQLDREERELEEQLARVKAQKAARYSPFLKAA